jgi:hypothetical protein
MSKLPDRVMGRLTYSCHESGRHGEPRASRAGDSRWMKAVANLRTVRVRLFLVGDGSTHDHTRSKVFREPGCDQS